MGAGGGSQAELAGFGCSIACVFAFFLSFLSSFFLFFFSAFFLSSSDSAFFLDSSDGSTSSFLTSIRAGVSGVVPPSVSLGFSSSVGSVSLGFSSPCGSWFATGCLLKQISSKDRFAMNSS